MAGPRSPNPIDVHVGTRVKARRQALGLSQEKLGESLGVTFQQVQKYEKGTNRVSASRMQSLAETLGVPIGYFFDGAPVDALPNGAPALHGALADSVSQAPLEGDAVVSPEGARLNRAFVRIADPAVRKRLVDLVCAVADAQETSKK